MGKKKPDRIKHIPQRTCVGCRLVTSKRSLVRLVKIADGIVIDPTGKLAGRGIYLHTDRDCWEKGLKGSIAKGLKTELSQTDLRVINEFIETLPVNDDQTHQIAVETTSNGEATGLRTSSAWKNHVGSVI